MGKHARGTKDWISIKEQDEEKVSRKADKRFPLLHKIYHRKIYPRSHPYNIKKRVGVMKSCSCLP